MTDAQFLVDRSLELGDLEADCEVEEQSKATVVNLTRKVDKNWPKVVTKFLNPVQVVQIVEKWQPDGQGSWKGDYSSEIEGQPVTIRAKFKLYPTDSGCCYSIEYHVKAKIPMVGKTVEKFVHGQAEEGSTSELDYAQSYLG